MFRCFFLVGSAFFGLFMTLGGSGVNLRSSSSMLMAARFLDSFLLFPSPCVSKEPHRQLVTNWRMWGGPDSCTTYGNKYAN